MSSILKALRKVEEEGRAAPAPALGGDFLGREPAPTPELERPASPAPRRRRSPLWLGPAVIAVVCALALAAWWWQRAPGGSERGRQVAAADPSAGAARPAARTARPAQRPAVAPAPAPAPVAVAPMPAPTPAAEAASPPPAAPAPPPTPVETPAATTAAPAPSVAVAPEDDEAPPVRLPAETPVRSAPAPAPAAAAEAKPKPAPRVVASVPKPKPVEPPPPDLRVERTVWHPDPTRRSAKVAVDGASPTDLKEGDRVGDAVVSRIEPSAVVFEHAGREVRIRVGSR